MSATSKNDKPQTSVSALSNPFSTSGGGVDFEHRVQATFLLALLVEGFSPLLNLPITSVLFQAKRSGYDTDDIVLFSSSDTYSVKIICQIKHRVTITEKNEIFKDVIASAWSDFNKSTFNKQTDKIVLISGAVANANSLRFIYDQANGASNANDFVDRIGKPGYSNDTNREKLNAIKSLLKKANSGQDVTVEQLWEFCKVFTILVFDLDYESSVNEFLIYALIASNCKDNAVSVWAQLVDHAARCDKAAAHATLANIPEYIKQKFKNILTIDESIPEALDFDNDSVWAKLALVGSWNEKMILIRNF